MTWSQGPNPRASLCKQPLKEVDYAHARYTNQFPTPLSRPTPYPHFLTSGLALAHEFHDPTRLTLANKLNIHHSVNSSTFGNPALLHSMIGFGFLPGVNTLSLIGIIGIIATVAQVAHAYEHSRDFYKSRSRPRPRHADTTTKHRPRNFTLVDRYEGKTFFECVHGVVHPPLSSSMLVPFFYSD